MQGLFNGLGELITLPFFSFWKQKGTVRALRRLVCCETLLKNLVGNADPDMCLCYELYLVNISMNVFLGLHMCKIIIDMV